MTIEELKHYLEDYDKNLEVKASSDIWGKAVEIRDIGLYHSDDEKYVYIDLDINGR